MSGVKVESGISFTADREARLSQFSPEQLNQGLVTWTELHDKPVPVVTVWDIKEFIKSTYPDHTDRTCKQMAQITHSSLQAHARSNGQTLIYDDEWRLLGPVFDNVYSLAQELVEGMSAEPNPAQPVGIIYNYAKAVLEIPAIERLPRVEPKYPPLPDLALDVDNFVDLTWHEFEYGDEAQNRAQAARFAYNLGNPQKYNSAKMADLGFAIPLRSIPITKSGVTKHLPTLRSLEILEELIDKKLSKTQVEELFKAFDGLTPNRYRLLKQHLQKERERLFNNQ